MDHVILYCLIQTQEKAAFLVVVRIWLTCFTEKPRYSEQRCSEPHYIGPSIVLQIVTNWIIEGPHIKSKSKRVKRRIVAIDRTIQSFLKKKKAPSPGAMKRSQGVSQSTRVVSTARLQRLPRTSFIGYHHGKRVHARSPFGDTPASCDRRFVSNAPLFFAERPCPLITPVHFRCRRAVNVHS